MIGAAAGAVFGGFSAEVINSAIPGNTAVAQPPAYALVSWIYCKSMFGMEKKEKGKKRDGKKRSGK